MNKNKLSRKKKTKRAIVRFQGHRMEEKTHRLGQWT